MREEPDDKDEKDQAEQIAQQVDQPEQDDPDDGLAVEAIEAVEAESHRGARSSYAEAIKPLRVSTMLIGPMDRRAKARAENLGAEGKPEEAEAVHSGGSISRPTCSPRPR